MAESDTQAFFKKFDAIDRKRSEFDRVQLLAALGASLDKAGHARLVNARAAASKRLDMTGPFVLVVFWGLGATIGAVFGWAWPLWIVAGVVIALVQGFLASRVRALGPPLALLLSLGWAAGAVGLAMTDPHLLVWTHAAPVALVVALSLMSRTLRFRDIRDVAVAMAGVGRSAPFVAPVVLVAVLLPALTADVWKLAAATDYRHLVGATVLSVGVLLFFVSRQLKRELTPAFVARCRFLAARATSPEMTRRAVRASVNTDLAAVVQELPDEVLAGAWPKAGEEYSPYLVAVEGDALRRPLLLRLLVTTSVVAILFAGYIYALLAVTVPWSVAADWSESTVSARHVALLGVEAAIPGDPYFPMALLLGIVATAIFLAFALTEEHVAAALTETLLREPIDRFLVLALPFVALLEWAIDQRILDQDMSDDDASDGEPSTPESGENNS